MKQYWAHLGEREKLLISMALGLVFLLLAWQFIAKPIANFPGNQKQAFETAQSDLKFMRASEPILAMPIAEPKINIAAGELQSIVTKIALSKDLPISRRQPKGDDELTLWLEDVLSVNFYDWALELTKNYNIVLQRVSINRNDDGTIRAQIDFSRGR